MITQTLGLEMVLLRQKREVDGVIQEYLLRKKLELADFMEVRYENFVIVKYDIV